MLAAKMDLLLKRLDERAADKEAMKGTIEAMDSQMTCEVCGEVGHSRNNCPKTREDDTSTTGSKKVTIMGGIINLAHKEVIRTSTQISIRINLP